MPEEDAEEEREYESGPFCMHWSDPSDCEECHALCACGHKYIVHWDEDRGGTGECQDAGVGNERCRCAAFKGRKE